MAKLIRSSVECAYKVGTVCLHQYKYGKSTKLHPCEPKNEENFPCNCPLEDGVTIVGAGNITCSLKNLRII